MKYLKIFLNLLLLSVLSIPLCALERADYARPKPSQPIGRKIKTAFGLKLSELTIFEAVATKDEIAIPVLRQFIEEGADLSVKDAYGNTPLHYAQTLNVIKMLVENGANINAKNNVGLTRLHIDVVMGHPVIVEFLIKHGADVNAKDIYGVTPLHLATMISYFENPKTALVGTAGTIGATTLAALGVNHILTLPTATAAQKALLNSLMANERKLAVEEKLAKKIIRPPRPGRISPELGQAVYESEVAGNQAIAANTAAAEAEVAAATTILGITAVVAALVMDVDIAVRNLILEFLIKAGAYVNAQDSNGNTPLHILASGNLLKPGERHGGVIMAQHLIGEDADRTIKNNAGKTPYDLAKENKRLYLMPILKIRKRLLLK